MDHVSSIMTVVDGWWVVAIDLLWIVDIGSWICGSWMMIGDRAKVIDD
jgi:hypothetical protein